MKSKGGQDMKHKVLRTALYIVLALVGVITVFPFVWMVLSSFKTNGEIQSIVQTLLPQEATVDNYLNLQETFDFLRYFMNSIFIAVAVTVLVIYTSCLCGYVLGKYQFKGKNIIFGFVMMTMMVPWSVTIILHYVHGSRPSGHLSLPDPSGHGQRIRHLHDEAEHGEHP